MKAGAFEDREEGLATDGRSPGPWATERSNQVPALTHRGPHMSEGSIFCLLTAAWFVLQSGCCYLA